MKQQVFSGCFVLATFCLFGACTTPDRPEGSAGGGTDATAGSGGNGVSGSGGSGKAGASNGGGVAGGGTGSGGDAGSGDAGSSGGGTGPVDACIGVTCDAPPESSCTSATEYKTYDNLGSCSDGECTYAEHVIACTCKNDACTTDPCVSVTCDQPPVAKCADADTLTTYAAAGTCDGGSCSYAPTDKACDFGCANGACKADPCLGVTCNTQPAAKCKDSNTKTTYAATGTCNDGTCSYAATDTDCPSNQSCSGQGVCAVCKTDTSCGAACMACTGTTPKCKNQTTSSVCVGCLSNADCSGATPVCNTTSNTCQARPSCNGLAKTCGPGGNQDCCASGVVTGGTFNRGNDPAYPATVANFRLDNYEVTLGRYRKFVAAYSQNMIASGAGKNPNNASDPGWNTAWNTHLPSDASQLHSACMGPDNVIWTATPGTAAQESLPINCTTWYEAAAFCIWDGGRLPTEAEWNYAAAGGTAQRNYPWGGSAPDCNYANFWDPAASACTGTPPNNHFARVGSRSPKGDGVWGQSDLAGNAQEWVLDFYADPYPSNCNNCANFSGTDRVVRGGFSTSDASQLLTSSRGHYGPENFPFDYFGFRCARNP